MNKEKWITVFAELGRRLESFGADDTSRRTIRDAMAANAWFAESDIILAICAIRDHILNREALTEWLDNYDCVPTGHGKTLGIIMAGNLPAVGFADLMYGVVCGYECYIKASSKDPHTISYLANLLQSISNDIKLNFSLNIEPDVLIATGSDHAIRHLRARYSGVKSLFRASRSSVAVLTGKENEKQLHLLANDIFTYNGLGCRNVSLLFLPNDFDLARLTAILSQYSPISLKYRNNYLQNKALLQMKGERAIDGGFFTLRAGDDFPLHISEIAYLSYNSREQADQWIAAHDHEVQCIVSESYNHPSTVPFGLSQFPGPGDYADRCDVVEFLSRATL